MSDFVQTVSPQTRYLPAISLFSGAGGLDIAAQNAAATNRVKWETLACVELENDRCDTLRQYFGNDLVVFNRDIQGLSADEVLTACGRNKTEIWLVYGGPPCQSFSQAGKQRGIHDPRGDLIFEFLRFVREISPPLFLMKNVPNLQAIGKGRLLQDILAEIDAMGYIANHRVLNAAHYGNPQKRRRLIVFGTRKDLGKAAALPAATHSEMGDLFGTLPFRTVGEAFAGLPPAEEV